MAAVVEDAVVGIERGGAGAERAGGEGAVGGDAGEDVAVEEDGVVGDGEVE